MQLVRKSKTVQQDKLRALPTCFLANMLQDYYHNLAKHKVSTNDLFLSNLIVVFRTS